MRAATIIGLAAACSAACSSGREDGAPILSVDRSAVDFTRGAPDTTAVEVVRVANTGDGPLVLVQASIVDDARMAFAVAVDPGVRVPAGGLLELVVRYTAGFDSGVESARLVITTDAGTHEVQLTAGRSHADAGPPDSGPHDTGAADAAPPDARARDSGADLDATSPDAGTDVPPAGYLRIAAGTFTMGSPEAEAGRAADEQPHTVTLTRDFWLKRTPVTQAEWRSIMPSNPAAFSACGTTCPVESVSWEDAVSYLNALSEAAGLPACYPLAPGAAIADCRGYRLPTEAEWEYAARAGSTAARPSGPLTEQGCAPLDRGLDGIGWYCGNAGGSTHPVGLKTANAWGLADMHGNVWEWVHDWAAAYPSTAVVDPQGPASGTERMFRGGGYYSPSQLCRSAQRWRALPTYLDDGVGFRPARTVDAP